MVALINLMVDVRGRESAELGVNLGGLDGGVPGDGTDLGSLGMVFEACGI
jgi:hypothetical protein